MRIFLDTSVLLAAVGSSKGASRYVVDHSSLNSWILIVTPYVVNEVMDNLSKLTPRAMDQWARLSSRLVLKDDVFTIGFPVIFEAAKDRPILLSALAWADVLLTLDRADFGSLLGNSFYGLPVSRPGDFLVQERSAKRLR